MSSLQVFATKKNYVFSQERGLPSSVKGAGLKIRYRRISWVRIPPLALNLWVIDKSNFLYANVRYVQNYIFNSFLNQNNVYFYNIRLINTSYFLYSIVRFMHNISFSTVNFFTLVIILLHNFLFPKLVRFRINGCGVSGKY